MLPPHRGNLSGVRQRLGDPGSFVIRPAPRLAAAHYPAAGETASPLGHRRALPLRTIVIVEIPHDAVVRARRLVRRPGPYPPEIVFPEMSSR